MLEEVDADIGESEPSSTVIIDQVIITEIDPQFDTGNLGPTILSFGESIPDGTALFIYGALAGLQSFASLVIYMFT